MEKWIAEKVRVGQLKPNTPFYMVNPNDSPYAFPFYSCDDPETEVWVSYEPDLQENPYLRKEQTKVFKVIKPYLDHGGGSSAFAFTLKVRYRKDEPAYPRIGYLFAFKALVDANRWFIAVNGALGKIEIWEADAEIAPVAPTDIALFSSHAEKFWAEGLPSRLLHKPPIGTVWCESITLRRRIPAGEGLRVE